MVSGIRVQLPKQYMEPAGSTSMAGKKKERKSPNCRFRRSREMVSSLSGVSAEKGKD